MPDVDYQSLKASLQDEAATLLAEIARLEARAVPRQENQDHDSNYILKSVLLSLSF